MPNIFHQSIEDILKAATPEQRLIWNYLFLRWGERLAISQYIDINTGVSGELSTYAANKLYFAYELTFCSIGAPNTTQAAINIYNELNTLFFSLSNSAPYWDATAAAVRYTHNTITMHNIYFGRINASTANVRCKFIGYRLGI